MFRISLTVCVSLLICGISAKPHQPWKEVADAAFQETNVMMSKDIGGKMFRGVEVEAPQDMDATDYDINPGMAIWRRMAAAGKKGEDQRLQEAGGGEENRLHPPSMAELIRARFPEQDAVANANANTNAEEDVRPARMADAYDDYDYQGAEEEPKADWGAPRTGGARVHAEPDEDRDHLDHVDPLSAVQVQPSLLEDAAVPFSPEAEGQTWVRVHLEPEEDMDDVYHPVLPVAHAPASVQLPADWSSQRRYDQPEEDLDELFHRL